MNGASASTQLVTWWKLARYTETVAIRLLRTVAR